MGRHSAPPPSEAPAGVLAALVIEDDLDTQAAMVRLLRVQGFDVETARNGLEGVAAVGRADFHVIVCDIQMPGLGGIGFFQQVEEMYPSFAPRVIFVTAYTESPEVAAFLELTGQPCFPKPFEVDLLVAEAKRIAAVPLYRRSTIADPGGLDGR